MNSKQQQELIDLAADLKTVEEGAVAVISDQANKLEAAASVATDFASLKQTVDDSVAAMRTNAAPLAAAIAANTPAAPAAPTLTLGGVSSVNVGATGQLTVSTSDGSTASSYASSDTSIATVDGNGLVTGVAPGSATITATTPTCSGSLGVTVEAV